MEIVTYKEWFAEVLPFWKHLNQGEKEQLLKHSVMHKVKKGTLQYHNADKCSGLKIVKQGRVRVFMNAPNGGEITLYRLLEGDICILSAACLVKSLNFDIHMEFEEDSEVCMIPSAVYEAISNENHEVKNFTLEVISSRFTDVMWLMNQLVFSNMGNRLAGALMEQSALLQSDTLTITHEALAKDLGTAREVVSRLLKQYELDGLVALSRGNIQILDRKRLQQI